MALASICFSIKPCNACWVSRKVHVYVNGSIENYFLKFTVKICTLAWGFSTSDLIAEKPVQRSLANHFMKIHSQHLFRGGGRLNLLDTLWKCRHWHLIRSPVFYYILLSVQIFPLNSDYRGFQWQGTAEKTSHPLFHAGDVSESCINQSL